MSAQLVDVDRWRRWLATGPGAGRRRAWFDGQPRLRGWTVDDLISPTTSAATDAMQAALVELAQSGDGDAAYLLLVQLRPGLHRLVRWTVATGLLPWHEATGEVRAVFFETIYRHPLGRRPTKIAANLILDTRQRIQRSHRSIPPLADDPTVEDAEEPHDEQMVDPVSSLAVLAMIQTAVQRLPGSPSSRNLTIDLAYRAWILDQPPSLIAAELGLGTSTISTRLHRLRSTLDREDLLC